VALAN